MKRFTAIAALAACAILTCVGTLYSHSRQPLGSKSGGSGARSVNVVNNHVFAGISPAATDGVDAWDTAAPPPPPVNYLYAYFLLDSGSSIPNYSVDVKKDESSLASKAKEWKLRAITDQASTLVTLNLPFASSLPWGFKPVMYDLTTGSYQNLRDNPNYSYTSPSDETVSSFRILIGDSTKPSASLTYPVGGEQFLVGSLETITWASSDASGILSQDVYYSVAGLWTHIAAVGSGIQTTSWTVPSGVSSARIVIVVMDSVMNVKTDSSGIVNVGHSVSSTAGLNGSVSPSGSVFVNDGASQTFTILPNSGYHVDSVIVNGIYRGSPTSYTFTNVRGDSTIRATFASGGLSDLVAQWSMDEGSGTILVDSSTYLNNGTLIGSPTWVTGVRGKAIAFNGSTQYATSPANPSFDITNAITLAVWIRPEVYNTQDLVKKAINGSTDGYELTLAASNGNPPNRPFVRFNQFSDGDILRLSARSVSVYPTDGTWMHLAATYDGTTIRLYINGVLDTTKAATFTIAKNSNPVSLGGQSDGNRKFQGQLDDARIYNRALSASEIHDLALRWYTITSGAGANGSISPSGSVTVVQGTNPSFTMTPASGYHVDSVFADGAYVGSMTNYAFTNVQGNHTISVKFAITRYTISASAGANGLISPSGSVVVNSGSNQAFTFTANTGYEVDSVIVDGINQGSMAGYTFSGIVSDHTIRVTFRIIQYTVTVTASLHGSIIPAGPVLVNYGSDTTFTLTPNTGYHIDSVFVDGGYVGNTSPYHLTNIVANHTISATFAIGRFTIAATAGLHGSITPNGNVTADYGSNQTFSFTPDAGYRVDSVIVDGVNQLPSAGYMFSGIVTNHTIHVAFKLNQYTVTATAGGNGTISPTGDVTVNSGDSAVFAISPALNYHISDVVVDGGSVGAVGTYMFRDVEANHTIVASFAMTGYTITATAGANGTISPAGPVAINSGTDTTITMTPGMGYHIDSVFVDGAYAGNTSPYHFTNVQGNHTISVKFAINTYSVTSSVIGTNGTIAPLGITTVNYGQNQSYTITPSAGYHIDSVFVDGVYAGNTSPFVIVNVTGNHTIGVKFAINAYTITSSVIGGNGTIAPLGTTGLTYGGNQSYTMTPNTGYHIDSIFVNGVYVGKTSPYIFTNVSASYTISVKFAINTYTIVATVLGGSGTINPSGTTTVTYGQQQDYTIAAAAGYHIDSIYVDGLNVGMITHYSFGFVTDNHTIAVRFITGEFVASEISVQPGWNLVSVPLTMTDCHRTALFPTSVSEAFAYQGSYVIRDVLLNCVGYWMRFAAAEVITHHGMSRVCDTVNVSDGWNMIGVLSNPTIASDVISIPPGIIHSRFFGYNGAYGMVSTLQPGLGYWVKTAGGGKIILNSSSSLSKETAPAFNPDGLNTITARTADGREESIYFAKSDPEGWYDLPPLAPAASLDIRFGGGTFVESLGSASSREVPILIASTLYPVTLSWDMAGGNGGGRLQIGRKAYPMTGQGQVSITDPDSRISLEMMSTDMSEIPAAFGLAQNYPNPFNPTTTITVALPAKSRVLVELYDFLGQRVATLLEGTLAAGYHDVKFNASALASGMYIYRISALTEDNKVFTDSRKMLLIK